MHPGDRIGQVLEIFPFSTFDCRMFSLETHAPCISLRAKKSYLVWEVHHEMHLWCYTSFRVLFNEFHMMDADH